MNNKTLEIIIVNYNSSFWLKKTLDSIYKYYIPYSKHSIIVTVVDNASSDSSIEMLEKDYTQINLIKSEKNVGFSAGNNIALKKSNADYIMLLNSDTELTEKSKNLDTLIDIIEEDDSIGMITPKLVLSNGQMDKACHRGEPSILDCFLYYAGFEKLFPKTKFFTHYHLLHKDLNTIHQVEAITGACMITKLKYFKDVDFFDERFFMYSEDMDLCRKYREKGYKILFNPTVEIIHHKYKSGLKSKNKKVSKNIKRHFYNSFLLYYDKWYNNKFYYKILRPFFVLAVKII
ncbi:MAG: glycosyltransferase family 2 protein [Elusimicrobia bacterium]|nr:glycosyltransferase family 2 protein [Elusimicrobiota bacterium]